MRKSCLLFIFLVPLFSSCIFDSKAKKDVSEFLNSKYGSLGEIVVEEVSEVDSLYTPFEALNSMTLCYSEYRASLVQALNKAYDIVYGEYRGDKRDAFKVLRKAIEETNDSLLVKIMPDVMYSMDHPDRPSLQKNRLGVKATFSLNGRQNTAFFYYNHDGKSIGHSSLQNLTTFEDVLDLQSEYRRAKSDVLAEL